MATKTFLHVGLPKSGTTYLQAVLAENKARLEDRAGLLFPGKNWLEQVRAVRDLRGLKSRGASADDAGAWQSLVDEIAAWDGDAVVSMEWLGGAPTEQVGHVVASLAPSSLSRPPAVSQSMFAGSSVHRLPSISNPATGEPAPGRF